MSTWLIVLAAWMLVNVAIVVWVAHLRGVLAPGHRAVVQTTPAVDLADGPLRPEPRTLTLVASR